MKSSLLIASLALCLTGSVWLKADDTDSSPPPPDDGGHHHFGGDLSHDDWAKLKAAHEAAIQANPDLAAEEKQLHEMQKDYMQKMHDAMVKADPSVEPILEKMHHHHGPPPPPDNGGDNQ
jgi:Spy/CpxP family protein refolding chaperone